MFKREKKKFIYWNGLAKTFSVLKSASCESRFSKVFGQLFGSRSERRNESAEVLKTNARQISSQDTSLVPHWLSVSREHGSKPSGGEKISSFVFELRSQYYCLP